MNVEASAIEIKTPVGGLSASASIQSDNVSVNYYYSVQYHIEMFKPLYNAICIKGVGYVDNR